MGQVRHAGSAIDEALGDVHRMATTLIAKKSPNSPTATDRIETQLSRGGSIV
jgi:hypothetical protein